MKFLIMKGVSIVANSGKCFSNYATQIMPYYKELKEFAIRRMIVAIYVIIGSIIAIVGTVIFAPLGGSVAFFFFTFMLGLLFICVIFIQNLSFEIWLTIKRMIHMNEIKETHLRLVKRILNNIKDVNAAEKEIKTSELELEEIKYAFSYVVSSNLFSKKERKLILDKVNIKNTGGNMLPVFFLLFSHP